MDPLLINALDLAHEAVEKARKGMDPDFLLRELSVEIRDIVKPYDNNRLDEILDAVSEVLRKGFREIYGRAAIVCPSVEAQWEEIVCDAWPHLQPDHFGLALGKLGFIIGYDVALFTVLKLMKEYHKEMDPTQVTANFAVQTREHIEQLTEEVANAAKLAMKVLDMVPGEFNDNRNVH